MPKFLYTIILGTIISGVYFANLLLNTSPESTSRIFLFLAVLGIFLTLLLSLIFYFVLKNESPNFSNLRYIYRKAFKIGVILSSGIVLYLGLKAFELATVLNVILLISIYAIFLSNILRRR